MKSIFVSSTFKDMQSERDMLNLYVFPEIAQFIRNYGEEVSFIDLRWGINTETLEEQESSHKILSVCLDRIDHSKPYLIAFLGERYGWIPDKKLIEDALSRKSQELSYLAQVEKSVTALEIEYGALSQRGLIDHCLFYFREPLNTEGLSQEYKEAYLSEGEEYRQRLEALKSKIIDKGGKIEKYTAKWDDENNRLIGLDKFKEQIIHDLKELIIKDFGQIKRLTWQEKELMDTELFLKEKLRLFSARKKLADQITDKVFSAASKLVMVKGELGFGKSTMIARLKANAEDLGAHVIPIVCGQNKNTSNSTDVWKQLVFHMENLLNMTSHTGGKDPEYRPGKLSINWIEVLSELAYKCSQGLNKPLVVFIDGVDRLTQFEDFEDSFRILLAKLPKGIIFVLSSINDIKIPERLQERVNYSIYTLENLNSEEKQLVIENLESLNYQKELVSEVKSKLFSMPLSNKPLYLSVMYQRMLMLDNDDFKEIVELGDGLEGQKEYMLRLIDAAPRDINGVCAMIMEEAANRINNQQCNEMLRLIAVSRRGLRESDLKSIFVENKAAYNELDFHYFYNYMRPYFYELNDGRVNFTNESFRYGILKNIDELQIKELNEKVFNFLESCPYNDPIHIDEYAWFAWKCDRKTHFLDRVDRIKDAGFYINYYIKGLYDISMRDKGEWLIALLKIYDKPQVIATLIRMMQTYFLVLFNDTPDEMLILENIFRQALESSEYIAKKYNLADSIDCLRVLPYYIGYIFKELKMYDKAIEYYNKNIKIFDNWGEDGNGKKFIYNEIGHIYGLLGNYDQALEYYNKAIEGYEYIAKKSSIFNVFSKLVPIYEKTSELCQSYGNHDDRAKFQNKANGVRELLDRISHDNSDNAFFKFEITRILFENQMDDINEHGGSGKVAEALDSCTETFSILENEIQKWNKAENLKDLAKFYERLAVESESYGNKTMAKECLCQSANITKIISHEFDHVDWYSDYKTRWYKIKAD